MRLYVCSSHVLVCNSEHGRALRLVPRRFRRSSAYNRVFELCGSVHLSPCTRLFRGAGAQRHSVESRR